jgi:hypothetical protein
VCTTDPSDPFLDVLLSCSLDLSVLQFVAVVGSDCDVKHAMEQPSGPLAEKKKKSVGGGGGGRSTGSGGRKGAMKNRQQQQHNKTKIHARELRSECIDYTYMYIFNTKVHTYV